MKQQLSASQVAAACGVSRQTIQSWYNEGLQRRPTAAQVMGFLAHREGYAPGSERERLARAQATKIELQNAQRRRELVTVEFVEQYVMGLSADIVGRLEALPARAVAAIGTISDPGEQRQVVLAETRAIRAGVAEYIRKLPGKPPREGAAGTVTVWRAKAIAGDFQPVKRSRKRKRA